MNAPAELVTRRAPLAAQSWNPDERTLEVTFSSGAEVERYDARGAYVERLALDQDWGAFIGAPVLDSHRRGGLSDVLGSVQKAWTVGGNREARAIVKLSRRAEVEPIVQDILDGHLRGVSVGYTVSDWKETTEGGRRVKTATRWRPVELSIVPIPADRQATIRGETMPAPTPAPADPASATPLAAAAPTPTASADRAAVNSEIRSIANVAGLDQGWIDGQIDAGATAEAARAAAFEAMRTRSAPAGQIRNTVVMGTDHSDPVTRAAHMSEALYLRINPAHTPSEPARAYVGLSIPEMARDCLRTRGISTTGLSAAAVIERALHSTSDFALALGDTVGRTLRETYKAAPSGIRQLGRQTTARDFRAKHRLQLSAAPMLEKVNEAGEFKSGTLAEAKESYKIDTFGRIIGLTRQALVNDDLGAFADLSRRMGQAAAAFEAQFLTDLLTSGAGAGPTMSDGVTLFNAAHGNVGAPLDWETSTSLGGFLALDAARLAMRRQTGLAGELISVTPKFLLIPPEMEMLAEKLLAAITPATVADVNPMSGRLTLVVEPRLTTAGRWYVAADPAEIDGLEYAYLEGEAGPQIETKTGFEVDGVQVKVRLDFGAGFVDWRGWFTGTGAV